MFPGGTGAVGADHTAAYVVVVMIVLMGIGLGIVWWKRRKIRVWISGLCKSKFYFYTDFILGSGIQEHYLKYMTLFLVILFII